MIRYPILKAILNFGLRACVLVLTVLFVVGVILMMVARNVKT
jgi:hypothetical protein